MKYNGKELIEMLPENWDGNTRQMLVWDDFVTNPCKHTIVGYSPFDDRWMTVDGYGWPHCAEIPKEELKIEIKPEYDFVENMLKSAPKDQNDNIILPKRAVEQMRELEKAFGIVYEIKRLMDYV